MGFTLTANLSVVKEWDGTQDSGYNNPEPGLYEVKTVGADDHKGTIKFTVESPAAGTFEVFVPKDMTKEANARKMRTVLLSHGAKAAAIDAAGAGLTFGDSSVVGKKAFVLVKKVEGVDDKGRAKLNDREFLTPAQAAGWKKTAGTNGAAAPAVTPAAPTGAAPGLFD